MTYNYCNNLNLKIISYRYYLEILVFILVPLFKNFNYIYYCVLNSALPLFTLYL